jgi:hypothetical protein
MAKSIRVQVDELREDLEDLNVTFLECLLIRELNLRISGESEMRNFWLRCNAQLPTATTRYV